MTSLIHFDTEQALKLQTRDQPTVLSHSFSPLKQISLLRYVQNLNTYTITDHYKK